MLSRNLVIGVMLIALTAGCTTWTIRTWQNNGYEASVVLAARSNVHIGSQEQRDRHVELINDLDPSSLQSYEDYQLTSLKATHNRRRALLTITVTANSSKLAIAGANAVSLELVSNPIDSSLDRRPLHQTSRATTAHSTTNPFAEGAATAVVLAILGIAGLAILTPPES